MDCIDFPKDFFVGGSFAYVTLHLRVPSTPEVPLNALVLRDNKQFVAVTDESNVVHFRPVQIDSTDGATVRIASGVKAGEKVIVNVPDEVADGATIQPVPRVE